jgi:broad specificity phosphatase PhoE
MNNCYFIVRHGESVLNEKKCHQGWITRNPLTDKGKLQAEEAAKKLKGEKVEHIYASPLLRAKQTARIIGNHLGLPISFSSKLKDYRRCQEHEGLHVSEYSTLPDFLLWKKSIEFDKSFSLPNGESLENFDKRVTGFAKWLDKNVHNKKVVIVTHDGVAQYLMQHWLGRTIEANSVGNAQIYKVIPDTKSGELI